MDLTPNLQMPYIFAAQAQKHVTHNEALRLLDAVVQLAVVARDIPAPPTAPTDGARYIVPAAATGAWSGLQDRIAAWQDGAWTFIQPREGFLVWVNTEDKLLVWDGESWIAAGTDSAAPAALTKLGINTTADTTNRLAVAAPATLLTNDGHGHQLKINKAAASDTASLLFQTAFSGRAEMGLTGDNDMHIKVSSDGSAWHEAIVINRTTGAVSLPATALPGTTTTIIDVKAEFGAAGTGLVDDATSIQNALDAAASRGGGTVVLPAGVYRCDRGLKVGSNVQLTGMGFSSIIRNPSGAMPATTMGGATVYCSIAMISVTNARVSNLTVDHATNGTDSNGIQIGEAGATTRSIDCSVIGCQLLGTNTHQYLIYTKIADRAKILNNRIVGYSAPVTIDLAGIEVYGSDSTEIAGNTVLNCGEGITLVQESATAGSDLRNIFVHDNRVEACRNGIHVSAQSGGLVVENVMVHNNIVSGSANRGIFFGTSSGSVTRTLSVQDNQVRDCTAAGIVFDGNAAATVSGLSFIGNTVYQSATTSHGIYMSNAKGSTVFGNTVSGTPAIAFYLDACADFNFYNNVCLGSSGVAALVDNGANIAFIGNSLINYGLGGASAGILARYGSALRFQGNYFKYGLAESMAIDCSVGCSNIDLTDNVLGWTTDSSKFYGGASGTTRVNWHPGVILPAAGYKHVSGAFRRPVGFNAGNADVAESPVDIFSENIRLRQPAAPASATASGKTGEIAWSNGFIFVCVADNTWKRAAIASW